MGRGYSNGATRRDCKNIIHLLDFAIFSMMISQVGEQVAIGRRRDLSTRG